MFECCNGGLGRDLRMITVGGRRDLEHLLLRYDQACNTRRRRVLEARSPEDVVRRRRNAKPDLADPPILPDSMLRAVEIAKTSHNQTRRRARPKRGLLGRGSRHERRPVVAGEPWLSRSVADGHGRWPAASFR